jgi:sporadic carbohydrate cluster 2OG-Fe(II) oxygenase
MYLLPPKATAELSGRFSYSQPESSESLYSEISDRVAWLEIAYGDVMVFNQALPHGNRVNLEHETRWSMNCRFKGLFTPYGDKKLGEFFEPITLRAASRIGMAYRHPGEGGV